MKKYIPEVLFPWVSMLTGAISLALRRWLFVSFDSHGLLPRFHAAGILSVLLLFLTAGVLVWGLQQATRSKAYRLLFPPSRLAAIGSAIGAVGVGISAFTVSARGILAVFLPAFGILATVALLYAAYCRLIGLRPNGLVYGTMVLFLVFRILAICQSWGSEPQVQLYLFPLLGSLFLLMTCYYRAEAAAMTGDYRRFLFFSQMTLFCCIICLVGDGWLFYLSAAIWLATDYCVLPAVFEETESLCD